MLLAVKCFTVRRRCQVYTDLLLVACVCLVALDFRAVECLQVNAHIPDGVNLTEMVILTCTYDPDQAAAIYWRKDGSDVLIQGAGFSDGVYGDFVGRADLVEQASLRINNTQFSDEGEYTCQITVAGPVSASSSGMLGIWYISGNELNITTNSNNTNGINITEPENFTLIIEASVENSRPAVNFTWTVDEQEVNETYVTYISENSSSTVLFYANSTLQLPLQRANNNTHVFKLMCLGTHPALSTPLSATFALNVTYPPYVTIQQNSNKVTCRLDGNPVSDVNLTKADGKLTYKPKISGNLATLDLGSGEIGMLTCEASNELGKHSANHGIIFASLPFLLVFVGMALLAAILMIMTVVAIKCGKSHLVKRLACVLLLFEVLLAVGVIILAFVLSNSGSGLIIIVALAAVAAGLCMLAVTFAFLCKTSDNGLNLPVGTLGIVFTKGLAIAISGLVVSAGYTQQQEIRAAGIAVSVISIIVFLVIAFIWFMVRVCSGNRQSSRVSQDMSEARSQQHVQLDPKSTPAPDHVERTTNEKEERI